MRHSELRVIVPRQPDSRSGPPRPVSLGPHTRHCSSGHAGHGNRAGRKSGAKVNRDALAGAADPIRSLRFEVPPRLLSRTPPVTRDACKTGWKPVCVLVHVRITRRGLRSDRPPAKVVAFPKTEGLFTGGIGCRKGSLPETPDRTFSPRGRTSALRWEGSAPLLPKVDARG